MASTSRKGAGTSGVFIPTRYLTIAAILWMSILQFLELSKAYGENKQEDNAAFLRPHYQEATHVLRNPKDQDVCRFYFAESAVKKNSGMGVFSAFGLLPGEDISFPDICIFVADAPRKWTHLHSHTWGWGTYFGQYEGSNSRAACEGVHTTYNTVPDDMVNTQIVSQVQPTNAGVTRMTPGAGSITHHYGIKSIAIDTISAGSELTIYYGDWDFEEGETYLHKPSRTPEWLAENGWCIDHVEIKQSTIDGLASLAGRGLFVKRNLGVGTVLAPAPLQIFKNRKIFQKTQTQPEQLYVNYCLQAANSKMLFYPYGPGVNLINHSSQPNVHLQWSTHKLHHGEFLEMEYDEFWENVWPGSLIMEVVASRDLQAGEELFMDYGHAWEAAWNRHVDSWIPPPDAATYSYAEDMSDTEQLRTVEEQKSYPYPSSVMTMCATPDTARESRHIEWYELEAGEFWGYPLVYCHVLQRAVNENSGADEYTVELIFFNDDLAQSLTETDLTYDASKPLQKRYVDVRVPRRAIKWNEKPYSGDSHLLNAFRHPILLPDNLVSKAWLDK